MWDAEISKKTNWNWKIGRFNHLIFHLKSSISMKYDITKQTAPKMPRLRKGTECVKFCSRRCQKTCMYH